MLSRVSGLLLAVGILVTAIASAGLREGGFELLTPKEYQSELAARAAPGAALVFKGADIGAPTITVVKPDPHAPIRPPVDIDLRFQPAQGATVNPASLRIMYGFLKLDITQRILNAPGVQVSAGGLHASGARLPSGTHKLFIEIADNFGRTGRQPFEFTVL